MTCHHVIPNRHHLRLWPWHLFDVCFISSTNFWPSFWHIRWQLCTKLVVFPSHWPSDPTWCHGSWSTLGQLIAYRNDCHSMDVSPFGPFVTNVSEIVIKIQWFSFSKIHCQQCGDHFVLGLTLLTLSSHKIVVDWPWLTGWLTTIF